MKFKYKNFLVYGTSVSGEWAAKLLLREKAIVYLYDDNQDNLKKLRLPNAYILYEINENLIEQFDYIVVSPSIPPNNQFLVWAKKYNIPILSELELASQFSKKLVAVTGTNGKTTTVRLISAILSKKYKSIACGNIGYPMSRAVMEKKNHIMVSEVSSFMLEHIDTFHPHIASILNISPDHLIRHGDMKEYTRLKLNILSNIRSNDYVVINLDADLPIDTAGLVVSYSCEMAADIMLDNGCITLFGEPVVAVNELSITGKHNTSNVMCAIAYGYIYRVSVKKMREALISFVPDKYRNERIYTNTDIDFINDSKSTNIASTLASVNSVKGDIILLLGGSKKNLDYAELFNKLSKKVKLIVAYGEIREDLVASNTDFNIETAKNMSNAFDIAVSSANSGDTILLSPATASYDEFDNFMERGKCFDRLVREYETKKE